MAKADIEKYVSKRTLASWVSRGLIVRFAPQVYMFTKRPTWDEHLRACWLASPDLVVSHRSAAQFWAISPLKINDFEFLSVSEVERHLPRAKVRESNCLSDEHWLYRHGIALTKPARTIVDLSVVWGPSLTGKALELALDKRLTTTAEVRRVLQEVRKRGRSRVRFLDVVLADPRYDDSKNRSWLERTAREMLRGAGLPLPVAQHSIPLEQVTLHPDFCYPEIGLAIELDGFATHGSRFAFDDDRRRDALLTQSGWQVVRFSSTTLHLLPGVVRSAFQQRNSVNSRC